MSIEPFRYVTRSLQQKIIQLVSLSDIVGSQVSLKEVVDYNKKKGSLKEYRIFYTQQRTKPNKNIITTIQQDQDEQCIS